MGGRILHDLYRADVRHVEPVRRASMACRASARVGRGRLAHVAEDPVKARPVGLGREPMPGGQQVFCGCRESVQLVAEDLKGEPCVQRRGRFCAPP